MQTCAKVQAAKVRVPANNRIAECIGLWVLKKSAPFWSFWGLNNVVASVLTATSYEVAGTGDIGDRLRNRTSRLMFWAVAARKNCSRTNFNLRSRSRLRPM